jgi:hypothetical protein
MTHPQTIAKTISKTIAIAALAVVLASAQAFAADVPLLGSAKEIVAQMMANEGVAVLHKDRYEYLSNERSERTGGHLWTEKVVETDAGKVRFLLAEDGQPLVPERIAQERGRLAAIVADPAAFQKREKVLSNDEAHGRQIFALLAHAFLFSEPRQEGGYLRIDFRPDPAYQTQSMEERVLHGMSGTLLVEPTGLRLHRIEGRLPQDVSLGFGLLATIRAGSSFSTTRNPLGEPDWKTTTLDTDIDGKAIFFKSFAKKQHAERTAFTRVANDMSVAQAVELIER